MILTFKFHKKFLIKVYFPFVMSLMKFNFNASYKEWRLTKTEKIEDIIPASIRWNIKECLSVISRTKIADVKGALVMPVRKATIPARTNTLVSLSVRFITPANTLPIVAPVDNAGAKIPPAPPDVNAKAGPNILSIGTYQASVLLSVKRTLSIMSFPDPKISLLIK